MFWVGDKNFRAGGMVGGVAVVVLVEVVAGVGVGVGVGVPDVVVVEDADGFG